jgi:large subunit ribosomal protein L21
LGVAAVFVVSFKKGLARPVGSGMLSGSLNQRSHFMFAVIRTGGKQYKVTEGETLDIELVDFPAEGEKKITISDVLLVGNGDKFSVGNPLLSGATVGLELVEEVKAPKVIAYKYRRREGYHRTVGHRQKLSRVKITAITI